MRFPNIPQSDAANCGLTALRIVLEFYGRRLSFSELHNITYNTREGSSLLGLSNAAEHLGFKTIAVKFLWEQLRDDALLPCIVHWNQNHFIVVYNITKHRNKWYIYVSDPAAGLLKYTENSF